MRDTQNTSPGAILRALLDAPEGSVLAVIAGVEGPSYRPQGAMMAVLGDGARVGTLSSGCIEADIALHGQQAAATGQTRMLRYGQGSPFIDIQLPCGGGLDILLVPAPDHAALSEAAKRHDARYDLTLMFDAKTGAISVEPTGRTALANGVLSVHIAPELRFVVFGKGPEACAFAALVQSVGYPNLLLSPDDDTRAEAAAAGCLTQPLPSPTWPEDADLDARTAVTLFFHDHDWEPPILKEALSTPAFYIGAQGSLRARDTRDMALRDLGVSDADLGRLHGPIGLIPSARDARTLAVSVLAEILEKAMVGTR